MSNFVVGITGGIGSGKSAVSDRFRDLGIHVVDADVASRVVVEPGRPALVAIAEHFGPGTLQADGTMDRAHIRKLVFEDPEERHWLNKLMHPLINAYLTEELAAASSTYVILAHPLLVETKQWHDCDRVLVVDAPEALQLERTMQRDNNSEEQVRAIIAAQASREHRLARADDVIVNDQDLQHLDAEVSRLHRVYLDLAKEKSTATRVS